MRKMPPPTTNARSDSGLISALSELSALGTLGEGGRPAEPTAANRATPERVNLRAVPLERIDDAPAEVELNTADQNKDGPFTLSESLSELASFSDPIIDGTSASDLLLEMREVSHPSASPLLITFGSALLVLLGIAGGWWLGRSEQFQPASETAASDSAPDNVGENNIAAAKVPDTIRQSGTVTYQDNSGTLQPDDGALVLLLPVEHDGSFRLHAKAFTKPAGDVDRMATLAALSAIGGAAVVSDEAGRYEFDANSLEDKIIVVVSRHQTRPADVPIPEDIADLLNSWFDSTKHICGQLEIQMKPPEAPAALLHFEF